mgnify:CR=1 FL=1
MPKTKEELQELKNRYESLNNELKKLSEDELRTVLGGSGIPDVQQEQDKVEEASERIQEYNKQIIHSDKQISERVRASYVVSGNMLCCKLCGYVCNDYFSILEHYNNVHNIDS